MTYLLKRIMRMRQHMADGRIMQAEAFGCGNVTGPIMSMTGSLVYIDGWSHQGKHRISAEFHVGAVRFASEKEIEAYNQMKQNSDIA